MTSKRIGNVEIVEISELKEGALLINGLPDVGLVGSIAASFLAEKLNMYDIGYIDSDLLPPVVVFHKEEMKMPLRIMSDGSRAVLLSEVALPPEALAPLARSIVEWAILRKVARIISLGGLPTPNRMDVEKPEVGGLGVLKEDREFLKSHGVRTLSEGFLAGIYALIAKEAYRRGQSCIILLAESHLNYPDPGAAASVLETLDKLFGVSVDVKPLLEKAEELRVKLRELMRRTTETLRVSNKGYEYTPPLMYR